MKKIYLSLLSLSSVLATQAQLTQANNAPANNDTYTMLRCDSTISPGPSGANAMWNFSTITTYTNLARTYTAVTASSATYAAANIELASASNDVYYLASSTSSLMYYGGNISAGMLSGTITYTAPAVYASYPMSYNTSATAAVGGTLYVPSLSASGSFSGTSTVLADGSGTISLPGGVTFSNTLRVVSSQTLFVTASIASATVNQVVYNYYAPGIKAPVFEVSTTTANITSFAGNSTTTQTFVARNKNATNQNTVTVSVPEIPGDALYFNVFPNPANTFVNVATNHPDAKSISIYDITGKLVEKQNLTDGKLKLDVSSYNKGIYLYTVSSGSGTLKTGKITVSQ